MKEIKFRAWDTLNNKYFENTHEAYKGDLEILQIGLNGRLQLITSLERRDESLFPDRFIIQQYTGLKDKNGAEIYEGDIIRITNNLKENEIDYNAQIIFKDGGFCAIDGVEDSYGVRRYRLSDFGYELKILGNIYENPELLGDSQ